MFSYNFANGVFNTDSYINSNGQVKFEPLLYEQRYATVLHILRDPRWNPLMKKVVDFGCAELRLIPLLRRDPSIEHILAVDINEELLERYKKRAVPLIVDNIQKRETPLRIEVLCGSIADAVEDLYDVDAVIALEVIEHLQTEVLEKVPGNIFGFIQPKLAIFSTPNIEFNVLFGNMLGNGFRHPDHKFEWTRKEFETWALNICETYPNYCVSFLGAGKPLTTHKNVGHATQFAFFVRKDIVDMPLNHEIVKQTVTPGVRYKTIYAVDYPFFKDERTKEEKILEEANYYTNSLSMADFSHDTERQIYKLPLRPLVRFTTEIGGTKSELLKILESNNFNIEGDFIIIPEEDEDDYRDNLDYYDDYSSGDEEEGERAENLDADVNRVEELWD